MSSSRAEGGSNVDEDDFLPTTTATMKDNNDNNNRAGNILTRIDMRRVGRGVVHLRRSGRIRRVCRCHHEMVRTRRKSEGDAQNKNMKTDVPPGRYGHTATISGDYMYIFGGQGGRYGDE